MAEAKFNDSTGAVQFNASTGLLQMVGQVCVECPAGTTPPRIRIAVTGITVPNGVGNCCLPGTGEDYYKILDIGDGWEYEAVLEQGGADFTYGGYVFNPAQTCRWSEIADGDFGTIEEFSLTNCGGSSRGTSHFFQRATQLIRLGGGAGDELQLTVYLARTPFPYEVYEGEYRIFKAAGSAAGVFGYTGDRCFPYDILLPSTDQACVDHFCICGGTALLTEMF